MASHYVGPPPVEELRQSFILGGGDEVKWEATMTSPHWPRWATQWMDAGDEGHRDRIFELVNHHLDSEMLLEYEATWDDGDAAGRALVLITKVMAKKNTYGLEVQHLAASNSEYHDWSQEEINKMNNRRLHLCFSKSPCRVVAPATGLHWIHLRSFRLASFAMAFNQEYSFDAAVAELGRQVNQALREMKSKGVPSGVPQPKSGGLPPKGGGDDEELPLLEDSEPAEKLPRVAPAKRKKKPPVERGAEPPGKVEDSKKDDSAVRAAAKQEANRAALALRTGSPVMVKAKGIAGAAPGGDKRPKSHEVPGVGHLPAVSGSWLDKVPSDHGGGHGGKPPGGGSDGSDSSDDDGGKKGRGGGRKSPPSSGSSGNGDDDEDDSRDDRGKKVRAALVVPPKKEKKTKRRKDEKKSDHRNKRGRSKEKRSKKEKKDRKSKDRKKRTRKRRKSSRSSSLGSSSETGSLEKLYGKETKKFDTLAEKAKKNPGRLLRGGLEEMRKYMQARVGEERTEQSWRQQRVGAYIQQVLFVRHNPSQIGVRNTREILTLSAALDALLEEDFAVVGDLLMQRLKAVESALVEGWNVASHQELIASPNASLTSQKEKSYAARQALQAQRLDESVRRKRSG